MIVLGKNEHYGNRHYADYQVDEVYLSPDARKQGTYVIGTTGTGKTTLLLNMVLQDIRNGDGLCVLDPHGDFSLDIMARVPDNRINDVIILDPSDIEYPFGLNLFDCNRDDPRERDLVVSTIIDTLHKLFADSWGPRMEDLLRHGILSLLLTDEPVTLVHLMMIMVNYHHRQRLTENAKRKDPILRFYWEDEFPENRVLKGVVQKPDRTQRELVSSSLNKIGRFITNPVIRHIVGQPQSSVDIRQVMDEGKILLVNLSKGDIGQDNSALLGAVFVNQILIAALSRREIPETQRRPFHLYVDEYQNFATKTFPQLQSEARKYGIDTVVAHQFRDQLDDENQGSSLNVANIINLRVSGKDAIELAPQLDLTPPEKEPRFEPIVQPLGDGVYFQNVTPGTGTNLYRMVERDTQAYSDVALETANLLAQMPNYQASARVLEAKPNPVDLHQFRIILADKPRVTEEAATKRIAYIRKRSRDLFAFTREEIADYIDDYTTASDEDDATPMFDTK